MPNVISLLVGNGGRRFVRMAFDVVYLLDWTNRLICKHQTVRGPASHIMLDHVGGQLLGHIFNNFLRIDHFLFLHSRIYAMQRKTVVMEIPIVSPLDISCSPAAYVMIVLMANMQIIAREDV